MTAGDVEWAMCLALDGHFFAMRMGKGGVCEVVDMGRAGFSANHLHRDDTEVPDTGSNRIHHGATDLTPAQLRRAENYLAAGLGFERVAESLGVSPTTLRRRLGRTVRA